MTDQPTIEEMLAFVAERLASGEPHRHHRGCIHNLSREEQLALRRRHHDGSEWTDDDEALFQPERHIVVITPDDWEIEPPWGAVSDE